ncbi:MAG: hypothetical protein QXG03_09180, partial [Halalkalicoccus sp.]
MNGSRWKEQHRGREIGREASLLDRERTVRDRARLSRSTLGRLGVVALVYVCGLALVYGVVVRLSGPGAFVLVPLVVFLAVLFEAFDSAAGMGFGTALAPTLFVLGYDPLQIVPILLVSEMATGLVAGGVHHM